MPVRVVVSCVIGAASCASGRQATAPPRAAQAVNGCVPVRAPFAPLELVVLGSGGPRSFGRGASSYVVLIDGVARVLVDAGPGAFVRLGESDVDLRALDTVLLTHLHVDHAGDLPGFVKSRDLTFGEPMSFRIFGPTGAGLYPSTTAFVDRLFGDGGAFAYLPSFRNQLRFSVVDVPASDGQPHVILDEAGLRITAVEVDHANVPARAYRIDHAGRSVVVSGDLASKNDNLRRLADGADVLVYDTAVVDPPGSPPKLYDLHTPPHRIGEVAAQAGVHALVLSHIPPAVDHARDDVIRSVTAMFHGPTHFAEDCLRVPVTR